MKQLRTIIEKNNFSGKERILLLIKNNIHYLKTGKEILSEYDKENLIKSWRPNNSFEIQEYNKYREVWQNYQAFDLDIQTWSLVNQLEISDFMNIILLFYYREDIKYLQAILEKKLEKDKNAINIIIENSGLNYKETKEIVKNLDEIIEKENLVVKTRTRKILNKKFKIKIITGYSFYYADDSIPFVKEYKKHINQIYMYGYLFNKLKSLKIEKKYAQLLAYKKIIKKLSILLGMDITNKPDIYLKTFESLIKEINEYLQSIFSYKDNK